MPYKLTVTFDGFTKAFDHLKKVGHYLEDDAVRDVTKASFNAAGSIFEKNFDSEGVGYGLGGWDDLADSTIAKRQRAGFGGEHPILVRYHDLRTITATALRIAHGSGTYSATDPDGKTIRVTLNIGRDGGRAVAEGDKAWNQVQTRYAPARPFWFTTKTVQHAVRRSAVDTLAVNLKRL